MANRFRLLASFAVAWCLAPNYVMSLFAPRGDGGQFGRRKGGDAGDLIALGSVPLRRRHIATGCLVSAAACSRPIRRAIWFETGLTKILCRYAACHVQSWMGSSNWDEVHEATALEIEQLVRSMRGA